MGVCLIGVEGTVLVSVIIAFVQIAMMRHEESKDCGSNCAGAVWLLGGALRNTGSEVGRHQQPTKTFLAALDRAKQQTPGGLGLPSLLDRMRPPVPSAPLALWVLGCFSLLLWLWALCTACHRKRAQRQQTGLQGNLMPVEVPLLRQTHLCSLSKSDTRLHELHRGPRSSIAPRPASMDLLHPRWLEISRGSTRSQVPNSAFPPRQLPRAPPAAPATQPSTSPEATYSNVGLAAIPRASLAASPVVWPGRQLTISCARLGTGAEYACIQKHKGTEQGCQESQQKAKVNPDTQMDVLYSRVCKPKRRDPRPVTDQLNLQDGRTILALGSDVKYEAITLRDQDMKQGTLENVYESIKEMGL